MTAASPPPDRLPGARTSCALLTLLTVMLAWPDAPELMVVLVRPAFFALLAWFFWRTGRASPALHPEPMRLVCLGFAVLWLGFTLAAAVHIAGLESTHRAFVYLRETCEGGALLLLGTTLIAYGLMLWIPHVLHSHQLLATHFHEQTGQLRLAESTRSDLEQRLVEADRRAILGELAATIAHDLRNPLTVVKGTAESLCRRPRDAAEIAEHTEVIRRNIDKADRTIAALIDLARPRAPASEPVQAHDLLIEIEQLLRVEARRRGVSLVVAAAPAGEQPTAIADRTLAAQALMNLALNAIQASYHGGVVRLVARRIGAVVALVIEDRGTGLPPELRAGGFRPFFTTKPDGTGLGLPSCRRIANECGGDLRLFPRTGGGTRAVLLLPIAAAAHRG